MQLLGKVAIVTGSGRGIGRDIAFAYAAEGASVVVSDVDASTSDATAREIAAIGSAISVPADVTSAASVKALVDAAMAKFGRIDILVNNAMKIVPGKLEEIPEADWQTTVDIGLKGSFLMTQAVGRTMIARRSGCIINIASIAGIAPYNWAGSYSTVKAGLIMMTKQVAMEWGRYGIRANAIAPGFIRTPGTEAMYADDEIRAGREACTTIGRIGTGEDVAHMAVFLATEKASYMSGSIVEVDGGQAIGLYLAVPGRRFSGGRLD